MKKKLIVLSILSLMVLSFIPVRMITMCNDSFVVSAKADNGISLYYCYTCEYNGEWFCFNNSWPHPDGMTKCFSDGESCTVFWTECS